MPETSSTPFLAHNSGNTPHTAGNSRNGSSAIWTRRIPITCNCASKSCGSFGRNDQLHTANFEASRFVINYARPSMTSNRPPSKTYPLKFIQHHHLKKCFIHCLPDLGEIQLERLSGFNMVDDA